MIILGLSYVIVVLTGLTQDLFFGAILLKDLGTGASGQLNTLDSS